MKVNHVSNRPPIVRTYSRRKPKNLSGPGDSSFLIDKNPMFIEKAKTTKSNN